MFTGIIQGVGRIAELQQSGGDVRIGIDWGACEFGPLNIGDSIAVNGVCLTAVEFMTRGFRADVSRETLSLTSLGTCEVGSRVNLEPALRVGDSLGGHLVSGHVDGLVTLMENTPDARSQRLQFTLPEQLAGLVAAKGSVTLDGISLTVNAVSATRFDVNIVPHTLVATNLGDRGVGDTLNIEVDTLARYVQRLLQTGGQQQRDSYGA